MAPRRFFSRSVTFVQRFGSLRNLNVHFHIFALDAAFICHDKSRPFFHKIEEPSESELAGLLETMTEAVELCLIGSWEERRLFRLTGFGSC
jgi:hypothetical protein